jgi:hypothetical protein
MMLFNAIIQFPAETSTNPGALGVLNTLGLAVFLVGIGLIILMVTHYYRMRGNLQRREKDQPSRGSDRSGYDTVSQYKYMSREEIKEMVLKERAEQEQDSEKAESIQKEAEAPMASLSTHDSEALPSSDVATREEMKPGEETPTILDQEQPSYGNSEIELLAKLTMPSEDEDVEEENLSGKSPKQPPKDQVQRSILSNELPEEFRRKSRKI